MLLRNGADFSIRNEDGRTVKDVAIEKGNTREHILYRTNSLCENVHNNEVRVRRKTYIFFIILGYNEIAKMFKKVGETSNTGVC